MHIAELITKSETARYKRKFNRRTLGKREKNMVLFIEILLIGVGLSMDAFAVSICKGLGMTKVNRKQALTIGLYFGGFQALMPFIGYMLGIRFEKYITSIDHWIAFILLGFIGGKMVYEAVKEKDDDAVVEKTWRSIRERCFCLQLRQASMRLQSESCLHLPMTA